MPNAQVRSFGRFFCNVLVALLNKAEAAALSRRFLLDDGGETYVHSGCPSVVESSLVVHDEHAAASHRDTVVGVQVQSPALVHPSFVVAPAHEVFPNLRCRDPPDATKLHTRVLPSFIPSQTLLNWAEPALHALLLPVFAAAVTAQVPSSPLLAPDVYVHARMSMPSDFVIALHASPFDKTVTALQSVASVAWYDLQLPGGSGVGAGVGAGVGGGVGAGVGPGVGFSAQMPAGTMFWQYPAASECWVVLTGWKQAEL